LIIEAPYDFLDDLLSEKRRNMLSNRRVECMKAFEETLSGLVQSDRLMHHLHAFNTDKVYYTLPTSVKDGMPLFYMPPNAHKPVISSKFVFVS